MASKAPEGSEAPNKIVTSDTVSGSHAPNKRWLIVAGVVLTVLVLGVLAWLVNKPSQKAASTSSATSAKPQAEASAKSSQDLVQTQALQLAANGDYSGGQSLLDSALKATSNKVIQGQLYENKAILAESAQKYSDAFAFAQKAESLNPTSNSALIIARVSEATGDKKTAAAYYLKAADRNAGYDADEYKAKAAELSK